MAHECRERSPSIVVLMPVFNDWAALARLLTELDSVFDQEETNARILIVDDRSTLPPVPAPWKGGYRRLEEVTVLPLRRNLGHQRAIALGLTYVYEHVPCEVVVVMDADGEDRPEDVPRLVTECRRLGNAAVVFARRDRRSENILFKLGYRAYQVLSMLTTGQSARVGNFSAVPFTMLEQLVTVSELWNHYAAAVFNARIPHAMLSTFRGLRHEGQSRMSYVSWVAHGMGAISVFGAKVGARLLLTLFVLLTLASVFSVAALVHGAGNRADRIDLWIVMLMLIVVLQTSLCLFALVTVIFGERDKFTFIPIRDYVHLILPARVVYARE